MACVLCGAWNRTTFSVRPTTDISSNDAQRLLVLGYWVRDNVPADVQGKLLCSRHAEVLDLITQAVQLEKEEAERRAAEAAKPPQFAAAEAEIRGRIENLGKFPCPSCGSLIKNGEVHACEV